MKQLCQSKYNQEITTQEFQLLQQKISYHKSSNHSFENSTIAQSKIINSIENLNLRQELFQQQKQITENSKNAMLTLCVETAKLQMDEYQKKFDMNMIQMRSDREQIPLIIINLIEERCKRISERIQCVYRFKAVQLIHFNYNS